MRQNSKKSKGLSAWIKKATVVDWILVGAILVALVAVIFFAISLLKPKNDNIEADGSMVTSVSVNSMADKEYDKNAAVVDKKEYGETILEETKDAGTKYVDETLFIGDSNTVRMMSYGHTTLSNDVGAVSMGIQHVISKPIVFFYGYEDAVTVPKAVEIIQPKRIVITYGTNNTIGWSDKTFITEYEKALKAIKKAYPYAEIIINSVPPIDKERENLAVTMQTIDSFNVALAKLAKSGGYKFLNSAEALKDEKTGFAKTDYTISDGIHLSKKGMEALFNYIRTHSYETEDTRPKPLKSVPNRKETPPGIISGDPIAVRGKKGVSIIFNNASPDMGVLEGSTTQTIKAGETCEGVTAMALDGFAFAGWSCTEGAIADTSNPTLAFTVPGTTSKEITVTAKFTQASMTLNTGAVTLEVGKAFTPTFTFAPANYAGNRTIAASSSNPAVASVAADGTITAVAAGTATIGYSTATGKFPTSIAVTVTAPTVSITDITLTHTGASIKVGESFKLGYAIVPGTATNVPGATFASDNLAVATVDGSGNVVGVGVGTTNISVTVGGIVKTCVVTVNAAVVTPDPPPVTPDPPPVTPDPPPVVEPDPTPEPAPPDSGNSSTGGGDTGTSGETPPATP